MRRLFRPTLFITAFNLATLLVSFVAQVIIAATFGARWQMDAYLAAFLLPSVASAVLVGSIGFVFIPIFVRQRSSEGQQQAWLVASAVFNLALIVFGVLTVVGVVARRPLLALVAPGLDAATLDLACSLAVILWPTLLFSGLSAILIGLNQAEEKFVWQAFVPLAGAGFQLAVIVLWGHRLGIVALAVAALAAGVMQLALLVPGMLGPERYRLRASLVSPGVKALISDVVPVMGSRVFSDATSVVDRYLASLLVVGSIAKLNYASRIPVLALSLFSAAIAVTIFPLMSRAVAQDDMGEFRRTFSAGTRYTWLFYLPLVVVMSIMAKALVGTLFERGQFLPADTAIVAALLPWYVVSMSARALGNISSRALYALKQARLMAALNVASTVLYVGAAFALVRTMGIVGIPIAAVITDWLFYGVHCAVIWAVTGRVVEPDLLTGVARITVAGLVGGGATWLVQSAVGTSYPVQLLLGGFGGLLAYAGVLRLLGAPEIKPLTRMLLQWVFQSGAPSPDGVAR